MIERTLTYCKYNNNKAPIEWDDLNRNKGEQYHDWLQHSSFNEWPEAIEQLPANAVWGPTIPQPKRLAVYENITSAKAGLVVPPSVAKLLTHVPEGSASSGMSQTAHAMAYLQV